MLHKITSQCKILIVPEDGYVVGFCSSFLKFWACDFNLSCIIPIYKIMSPWYDKNSSYLRGNLGFIWCFTLSLHLSLLGPLKIYCEWDWGTLRIVDDQIKGLFIWARSTGLARFPRSRLATPARWPGRNIFDKIASCSPDSGQNGIILVLYVFPLQEYAK